MSEESAFQPPWNFLGLPEGVSDPAHARGWRRLTTPLLRRLIRRDITSDYRRLKRILETPAEPES